MAAKDNGKVQQKKYGRGANQCQLCGRKQGLVRRYNFYCSRGCFREGDPTMGIKKMNEGVNEE